jgi:hypothetical protein
MAFQDLGDFGRCNWPLRSLGGNTFASGQSKPEFTEIVEEETLIAAFRCTGVFANTCAPAEYG